jgi:methyltransferase (TIGR00027 family)
MRDQTPAPDSTAVRVALWRALHAQIDPPPHIFKDEVGLRLISPEDNWRLRPDMDPQFTKPFRAAIVARARFMEDFVIDQLQRGIDQYVILGSGLDTFAQRRPELGSSLTAFEIDRPETLAWKQQRLIDAGFGIPDWLRFIPVDFEAGEAWPEQLRSGGFNSTKPAVVAAMGVTMYLTKDAVASMLKDAASFAPGSTLGLTFLLPIETTDPAVRNGLERAAQGAQASGTPFVSFFTPTEILSLARQAGFRTVEHVSAAKLADLYFSGRLDGLRPPRAGEELLLATV